MPTVSVRYVHATVSRYREPTTQEQALVEALSLGLMAPDDEKAQAAGMLAEELAVVLDEATVEKAKSLGEGRVEIHIGRGIWQTSADA